MDRFHVALGALGAAEETDYSTPLGAAKDLFAADLRAVSSGAYGSQAHFPMVNEWDYYGHYQSRPHNGRVVVQSDGNVWIRARRDLMLQQNAANFQDAARLAVDTRVIRFHHDFGVDVVEVRALEVHNSIAPPGQTSHDTLVRHESHDIVIPGPRCFR